MTKHFIRIGMYVRSLVDNSIMEIMSIETWPAELPSDENHGSVTCLIIDEGDCMYLKPGDKESYVWYNHHKSMVPVGKNNSRLINGLARREKKEEL